MLDMGYEVDGERHLMPKGRVKICMITTMMMTRAVK